MSKFPYMDPLVAQGGDYLRANAATNSHEAVVFRTTATTTLQACWACADSTAPATTNLTVVFYNRGTAGAGTTILGTAGGSESLWGATTPKTVTLANNTGITADSYITAITSRQEESSATAWTLRYGFEYLTGSPATAN